MSLGYFWHPDLARSQPGGTLLLDRDEGHHLATVLRIGPGEIVGLMDGLGHTVRAEVLQVGKSVSLKVLQIFSLTRASGLQVFGPLPEGKRLPYLFEKLQELGVRHFAPLKTDKGTRDEIRLNQEKKLEERLKAACKQSQNPWLMTIGEPRTLEDALREGRVAVLDLDGVPASKCESIGSCNTLLYGPQSGWSDREKKLFGDLDVLRLRISGHHLRMETAAVVGAAICIEWQAT